MQSAIDVTIQIFVVSTMLVLGLQVPLERFVRGVRDWRTIATGALLNLVVIPALALLAATALDLSAEIRTGYLLIAFSPGAPYALKLIAIARGEVASSVGLIITLQLAGVVWVPVLAHLFLDSATSLEYSQLLAAIILLQLVPLIMGLIGQGSRWMGSSLTTRATGAISNASFVALVVLILIHDLRRVVQILDIRVLTAVVGLIIASLTTGVLLAGREPSARCDHDRRLCANRADPANYGGRLVESWFSRYVKAPVFRRLNSSSVSFPLSCNAASFEISSAREYP
jgi:bile acid:Na+ symporter, BASS family